MTENLFSPERDFRVIPMPDAEVLLRHGLPLGQNADAVFAGLLAQTPWRSENIRLWGKEYVQPRLLAWVGDEDASYAYSGKRHDPLPWTPLLLDLRRRVEEAAAARFNSVLLNLYRDHRDSMGMHSDDEPELGPNPVVASLSLGETRTLVFRHRTDKTKKSWKIPLESASLLLMKGSTQRCWQHGIAKLSRPCGPRINLTFRRIVAALGSPTASP